MLRDNGLVVRDGAARLLTMRGKPLADDATHTSVKFGARFSILARTASV